MTEASKTTHTVAITPCILECGYEQVWIEKSNRHFPAWKIRLETGSWWRSKLDFRLLSRQSSVPLPKTAFRQLAQESPWQRPNADPAVEQKSDDRWKPYMKKNLQILDQYLLTVQTTNSLAWNLFSRQCDTENLWSSENDHLNCNQSKQLGQYFCSRSNAKHLTRVLMERLIPEQVRDWVIIEPSCGHGIIMEALVEERQQFGTGWKMVGIDVDPDAVTTCRQNYSTSPQMSQIQWKVADFLSSSKHNFGIDDSEHCIVIGNPPFHLAQEFVNHAIVEYKARFIVFVMPRRLCGKSRRSYEYGEDYECEYIELESCDFYFQGDPMKFIKQPSSIQCVWRRK
jgi:predicted RNA methylase